MRKNGYQILLIVASCMILLLPAVWAEEKSSVSVTKLTENIMMLSTQESNYTTNSLAFVGEDGLMLVDTQAVEYAEDFKKAVESFGKGLPDYIILTHRHVEHIGGHAQFGPEPIVISHYLLPSKLKSGGYLFDEYPQDTYPDITIDGTMSIFFNDEEIRLVDMAGSHDDNEIMVHFTTSKIVHLSSLVNGFTFPSVDSDGDVLKFPELIEKAIKILPEDVTIISGHNKPGSYQDLKSYHHMLTTTIAVVKDGLVLKKDLAEIQKDERLKEFESFPVSYVSLNAWIEKIFKSLTAKPGKEKKTIYEPLYYALKQKGVNAAVQTYHDLKRNHAEGYDFDGVHLLVIVDKLIKKQQFDAAEAFCSIAVKDYPDHKYNYYFSYLQATLYQKLGHKQKAIEAIQRALKQNPEFKTGKALLEELTNSQ